MSDIAIIQKATLYEMADAIIDTTERTEAFKVSDMPTLIREDVYNSGYNKGVTDGKQAQYDEFWDMVLQNGARTNFPMAFARWSAEYIRPKYKVIPTEKITAPVDQIFRNNTSLKVVEKAYFDFSQLAYDTLNISIYSICYGCSKLLTFEDIGIQAPASYGSTWQGCGALQTIEVLRSKATTTFSKTFMYCYNLINLTVEGTIGQNGVDLGYSTKLSQDSIISVLRALSDSTSGLSITLSKIAVDNAFVGGSSGSAAWQEWVAEKSNWTINLI